MKTWYLACGVACLTVAAPTVGIAQSLVPVVDIAPHGFAGPLPLVGVLPPEEIVASVRSAGFDPMSRPVHRGPVYVVFAIDRYDAEVRVIVDAHSGRVLRAVRLAGEPYDEPRYGGYDHGYGGYAAPRMMPPAPPPYERPAYERAPYERAPYDRPPHFYERDAYERDAPVPPADVPGYGAGRGYGPPPIEEGDMRLLPRERGRALEAPARRGPAVTAVRPPVPRSRPGDVTTGAAKESTPLVQTAPQAPPPAPLPAAPADSPVGAAVPQQPGMAPIAPLE
jgi:hypothetical protein